MPSLLQTMIDPAHVVVSTVLLEDAQTKGADLLLMLLGRPIPYDRSQPEIYETLVFDVRKPNHRVELEPGSHCYTRAEAFEQHFTIARRWAAGGSR